MTAVKSAATRSPHVEGSKLVTNHAFLVDPFLADLKSAGCVKPNKQVKSVSWNIRGEYSTADLTAKTVGDYTPSITTEPRDVTTVTCEGGRYGDDVGLGGVSLDENEEAEGEDRKIDLKADTLADLKRRVSRIVGSELINGNNQAGINGFGQRLLGLAQSIPQATITVQTLYGLSLLTDGWDPEFIAYNSGTFGTWAEDYDELLIAAQGGISDRGGTATHAYAPSAVVEDLITKYRRDHQFTMDAVKVAGQDSKRRAFKLPFGGHIEINNNIPADCIFIGEITEESIELRHTGSNMIKVYDLGRDTDYIDEPMSWRYRWNGMLRIKRPERWCVVKRVA